MIGNQFGHFFGCAALDRNHNDLCLCECDRWIDCKSELIRPNKLFRTV